MRTQVNSIYYTCCLKPFRRTKTEMRAEVYSIHLPFETIQTHENGDDTQHLDTQKWI